MFLRLFIDNPACSAKDSDKCLHDETGERWKYPLSTWNCHDFKQGGGNRDDCDTYAKDVRRCCPEACGNEEPFTKAVCEATASTESDECRYPHSGQCSRIDILKYNS